MTDSVQGLAEVVGYGRGAERLAQMKELDEAVVDAGRAAAVWAGLRRFAVQVLVLAGPVAVLAVGAPAVERGTFGTAALEDPEWTERAISDHGDLIAVSLDVRGSTLAARGWTREGGNLWETLERLNAAGCSRYVVTDVTRDGTLTGPNIELLRTVASLSPAPVVASGGIARLEDIAALTALVPQGVDSAIIGKALYNGDFTSNEGDEAHLDAHAVIETN